MTRRELRKAVEREKALKNEAYGFIISSGLYDAFQHAVRKPETARQCKRGGTSRLARIYLIFI